MDDVPEPVAELVDVLAELPGAVAVVIGGSRALGLADAGSDWDLGLYYRGEIDLRALSTLGEVYPPGAWGRIMNGGAWLERGGVKVDVLLRDLNVVEGWLTRALDGAYEVDALLGYLAGVPTYSLCAELALCRRLTGALPDPPAFPDALAEAGEARWRFHSGFSLSYARMHARRGDFAGAVGSAAKAAMEAAHARVCARRVWTLNEKRLLAAAGLSSVQTHFAALPTDAASLPAWVEGVAAALEIAR